MNNPVGGHLQVGTCHGPQLYKFSPRYLMSVAAFKWARLFLNKQVIMCVFFFNLTML